MSCVIFTVSLCSFRNIKNKCLIGLAHKTKLFAVCKRSGENLFLKDLKHTTL